MAAKKKPKPKKKETKPCEVKPHFWCDGTGTMCEVCNESETSCRCEEAVLSKCEECSGTGRLCVEHESGCHDASRISPKCDKVRDEEAK